MKDRKAWTDHLEAQGHKSKTKKVKRNKYSAKKTKVDDIVFDSKLEAYCYSMLKRHNISFRIQEEYVLQESMKVLEGDLFNTYGKVRRLTLGKVSSIVDFVVLGLDRTFIIDTKGMKLNSSMMKYKILYKQLTDEGKSVELHFPSSNKEVNLVVQRIHEIIDQ